MTGYVRKDTTNNIADGNVINAADLDAEFDGVQDAFNASTGHKHDGTAGEGATINALGPTQDVTISATLLAPKTTNTVDIGSSALKFKDLFLAGNGSIGGTLAVTGVATFTAQPILSSLTASRAVFTDGSKGLVSNAITGTGNVVMSASPTLTGTIDAAALTASGAVTLSGGTANGVAYLNGSKVVTSGSALTFNGTNTFTVIPSTGTAYNRTESTQYSTWLQTGAGNANVFWEFSAGTPVRWVDTSSGELMRLTSTGLGIGTSSPSYKLQVASGSTANNAYFSSTATTAYTPTAYNGDKARLFLAGGNGTGATNGIEFTGGGSNENYFGVVQESGGSGAFVFQTYNGSAYGERLRLDSSGNLGLGVTPSAWSGMKAFQLGDGVFAMSSDGAGSGDGSLTWNGYYNGTNWIYGYTGGVATRYRQNESGHAWFYAPSGTAGNAITFSQAMTLDASGNWMTGTTTAIGRATVVGGGTSQLAFHDGNGSGSNYGYLNYGGSSGELTLNANSTGGSTLIRFLTSNSGTNAERVRITSSGQALFGLTGNAAPAAAGVVIYANGNSASYGVIGARNGSGRNTFSVLGDSNFECGYVGTSSENGTDALLEVNGANGVRFTVSGTEAARISSTRNFGIGNSSPSVRLDVTGANTSGLVAGFTGDTTYGTLMQFSQPGNSNRRFGIPANVDAFIWTGFNSGAYSEQMRLDASGNLLIGKTTASASSGVGVQLEPGGGVVSIRSGSTNSDLTWYTYSTGAGTTRFYVGMGGTVYATSTSISAISDSTLKENIRNLETGLAEVMALQPRRFDWKNGDAQNVAGFVAQEVEQVLPELVTDYIYSKDEDGNDIIKKSLKMGDILPTLVKAIQEQQAIIESLKARLDAANL